MNRGALLALSAYMFWGLHPVYWKLLKHVPATQILTHRIIWSLVFFVIINTTRGSWVPLYHKIKAFPRKWIIFTPALLIGSNWGMYIWSVNANYVLEVSLGYFISPLLIVFLGVFVLHEKLRRFQWLAIIMAAGGMLYLTFVYGQIPWIALFLAGTWGFYSLLRKKSPLNSVEGLTIEVMTMLIPAVGYLIYLLFTGQSQFLQDTPTSLLLMGTGLVSGIPLIVFIAGARQASLTTIGILQYVYPTNIFLLGVFGFHEPLDTTRLTGFILIWTALLIYTIESTIYYKSKLSLNKSILA